MEQRLDGALQAARDADYWELNVRFGPDTETELQLVARFFNTLVHFLPPDADHPQWRVEEERLDGDEEDKRVGLGDVSVAQVIDTVPHVAERWVLWVTRETVEYLMTGDELDDREPGLRLNVEWEQGEAHHARWESLSERRYGEILLYDFPERAELNREIGEEAGRATLFVSDPEVSGTRVLVVPDEHDPWRWSEAGHVEEFGERLPAREALERAGPDHEGWVREQTGLALGATLRCLREIQERALTGRDTGALQELARLAGHARELADGLQDSLTLSAD